MLITIQSCNLLVIVIRTSSQHLSAAFEDVRQFPARGRFAGVECHSVTLHLETKDEPVLGDEFFWLGHPVEVELVSVRLCATRAFCWPGIHLELLKVEEEFGTLNFELSRGASL